MFENKNVCVTGGTGMIGRELVKLLVERGASVLVVSLDDPSRCPPGALFAKSDITRRGNCAMVCKGADYVFHLAGIKGSPQMTAKKPASFFVPMLQFNTNMMQAAYEAGAKWYLYTSSVGVYAPAEVFREDDVWTTFPSKNDWFAGWAKRMGELQAQAYAIENDWNCTSIVRPANVYGSYDNFDPANAMVIPSLIRRAMDGENPLTVWGDGTPIRDFIHARDVARGMLFAVENKITEPINLGSGTGVTIKDIVEIIVNNLPNKPDVVWDTSKPAGDKKRLMSMERASGYGFKTTVSLEEGIKETMQWYAENKGEIDKRYNVFSQGQTESILQKDKS